MSNLSSRKSNPLTTFRAVRSSVKHSARIVNGDFKGCPDGYLCHVDSNGDFKCIKEDDVSDMKITLINGYRVIGNQTAIEELKQKIETSVSTKEEPSVSTDEEPEPFIDDIPLPPFQKLSIKKLSQSKSFSSTARNSLKTPIVNKEDIYKVIEKIQNVDQPIIFEKETDTMKRLISLLSY